MRGWRRVLVAAIGTLAVGCGDTTDPVVPGVTPDGENVSGEGIAQHDTEAPVDTTDIQPDVPDTTIDDKDAGDEETATEDVLVDPPDDGEAPDDGAPIEDDGAPIEDDGAPLEDDGETPPEDADVELTCEEKEGCDLLGPDDAPIVCITKTQTNMLNDCFALCAGFTYDDFTNGPCDEDCSPGCDGLPSKTAEVCTVEEPSQKFPNEYKACCAGYTLLEDELKPCPSANTCDKDCPTVSQPVCGLLPNGTEKTYLNSCAFDACAPGDGAVLQCNAPCGDPAKEAQCGTSACDPVCDADGVTTYFNKCYAAGAPLAYEHECCDCGTPSALTLVCSDQGKEYGNECFLTCLGAPGEQKAYDGPCISGCAPPEGAVKACGNYLGEFTMFPSVDCAEKAGATCVYEGDCVFGKNPCPDTHKEYDPVCAEVPTDTGPKMKTFANTCFAGCEGAKDVQPGICAECATVCPCDAVDAPADQCKKPFCASSQCVVYPNLCVPTKCLDPVFQQEDLDKETCPIACQ